MNSYNAILNRLLKPLMSVATLASLLCIQMATADDTAVYLDYSTLPPEETRPVVVFVLDSSGSMGEPIEASRNIRREHNYYSASTTYVGKTNYAGGAGDPNYIYLYKIDNSFADPYIFVNKVHINQIDESLCISSLLSSNRNPSGYDTYLFGDPTNLTNWQGMCPETTTGCGFTASATSALRVDCRTANTYITNDNSFPSTTSRDNRLYAFNYNIHNYLQGYYRYTVLQQVVKDLIDDNYNINLSLMRFNGSSGGYVLQDSLLATNPTNQNTLKSAVSRIIPADSTPLTESLWEAARYLRGEQATYGHISARDTNAFTSSTSSTYSSPIEYACQESHIVLLTDGEPTSDGGVDSTISDLPGIGTCSHSDLADEPSESCLDDLAKWLHYDPGTNTYDGGPWARGNLDNAYVRDHRANTTTTVNPPSTFTDTQPITVHTIGFGLNNPLLTQTAEGTSDGPGQDGGGGLNETATTAEELEAAFALALGQAEYESDTAVAPAVAINAYSGLQHRDELYFALYKPANSPRWYGNVKKYRLVNGQITGVGDEAAVDSDPVDGTGYFLPDVSSYWTIPRDTTGDGVEDFTDDGEDITIGGFATQLTTPTTRRMYTYTGATPTAVALTGELLNTSNTNINSNPSLLSDGTTSVTTAAQAAEIINWVRGGTTDYNDAGQTPPNQQPNFFVADIIHNPPAVVSYTTDTTSSGCTTDDPCFPDDVLFAATNMGILHAINAETGVERWSFIPKELLPNLTTYYEGSGGFTAKVYGLDGPMTVWRKDANGDGTISTGGSDHVYIYQPMRRGGSQIYAFDVTSVDSPELMWQINGTALDDSPSGDFADLAQTWSAPQRAKVRWCDGPCINKDVLFFGGGYDPVHDTATSPQSSSAGNAIYMVDAETSELLWSAGNGPSHDFNNGALTNSFVADVSVNDVDGDGAADVMFAIDIQGNLWRFDFNENASSGSNLVGTNGGLIAQLGGSSNDFRRFYNAPDVAFFSKRGQPPFFTISVASGHREDPRETIISDYLFVIFDRYATSIPANYGYDGGSPIQPSDLTLASLNPTTPVTIGNLGWRLALTATGEKGLSETVTFNGSILLSTYIPSTTFTCEGSTGSGRYYLLDALRGVSTNIDDNGTPDDITDDTRTLFVTLRHGGIPPKPTIIFGSKPGDCIEN